MKALILAAGYATRLGALTRERPKPLLEVGGRALIDHLLAELDTIEALDGALVVTNARFAPLFASWGQRRRGRLPVSIIDDRTSSDATKLGALGDIRLVLQQTGLQDDLFVGAADNLFDFGLTPFFETFQQRGTTIGLYDVGRLDLMPRYSEVHVDDAGRIVNFIEKPAAPTSTLMATGLYLYRRQDLALLERYRLEGGNMDSPGYFPAWLHRHAPVHGPVFRGRWYDIGSIEQYQEALQAWEQAAAPDAAR